MNRFSDKIKIIYLTLVILFSLGVFLYLLDTWGIIRLEDRIPYLKKEPPVVAQDFDSPTELDQERMHKEEQRLKDEELHLKEMESDIQTKQEDLTKKREELDQIRKGLEEERRKYEEKKQQDSERSLMIRQMADRITAMPPDDAVAIVAGWSDSDLVDVFLQMEKDAEDEGKPSIVPYLITKLPRERASIITSLMMDEQAKRLPQ